MDKTAQAYERLIERFVAWAQSKQDIDGALVIGSRARPDCPADEWADLDLVVLAADPARYLSTTAWLEHIGTPVLSFRERGLAGEGERRVLFEDGLDVDIAILPSGMVRRSGGGPDMADLASSIQHGARVIVDKGGVADLVDLFSAKAGPVAVPSQDEFQQVISDFWFHTLWTAKHLRRGELWRAGWCCNAYLKDRLLCMLEWHAQASGRLSDDSLQHGHFVEKWADPRAVAALPHIFARYDEDDIWRALFATMDIFRWLSSEAATQLRYPLPDASAQRATEMVTLVRTEENYAATGRG